MSSILKKEGFKADIGNHDNEDKVDLVVDGVNKILERVVSSSKSRKPSYGFFF